MREALNENFYISLGDPMVPNNRVYVQGLHAICISQHKLAAACTVRSDHLAQDAMSTTRGARTPVFLAAAPERRCAQHSAVSNTPFRRLRTVWPSGLRRWLQAPVRKGVGSNPTAVTSHRCPQLLNRNQVLRNSHLHATMTDAKGWRKHMRIRHDMQAAT